jgi:NAD(P)-dependent dehydrogenase (short-subunit alcohol dehydrogenase family)
MNAAAETLVRGLAVEVAPVRVNLIAAGFVDTPMSAKIFGDEEGLEARRAELKRTLPIRRVVRPEDVAWAALHLMTNTAITRVTLDLDGGQNLV